MVNISQDAEVSEGQVVISSGLGGVFPPGLVIGEVIEVGQDEYGLLKYAIIKPAVNFNSLEEVFVVKSTGDDFLNKEEIERYKEEFSQEEHFEEYENLEESEGYEGYEDLLDGLEEFEDETREGQESIIPADQEEELERPDR